MFRVAETLMHRVGFGSVHEIGASARVSPDGKVLLPHFLLVGAQKSASTFLHNIVRQHPAVFMPLDEVLVFEDPEYGHHGLEPLRTLFPPNAAGLLRGLKRPDYLARPEVPGRVATHVPDAKILIVLRHPVQRLLSAYYYYMRLGLLPLRPLNEGLLAILDGDIDIGSYPRAGDLLLYSRYGESLARWYSALPRRQFLVLLQDDLQRGPRRAIADVFGFLGLDPSFRPRGLGRREMATVYDLRRLACIRVLNKVVLKQSSDRRRLYFRPGVVPKMAWAAGIAVDKLVLARALGNRREQLDPALAARLTAYFADDIACAEHLTGHDLSAWQK